MNTQHGSALLAILSSRLSTVNMQGRTVDLVEWIRAFAERGRCGCARMAHRDNRGLLGAEI
jgi:hypothetical protein